MEAALAEMALDDVKEPEDDVDFVNDKGLYYIPTDFAFPTLQIDEADVFESDFESTDEETAQAETEGADNDVQDEEKRARKVAWFCFDTNGFLA